MLKTTLTKTHINTKLLAATVILLAGSGIVLAVAPSVNETSGSAAKKGSPKSNEQVTTPSGPGQPQQPGPIAGPPLSDLTVGGTHACYLSRKADTIWCWGGENTTYVEEIYESPSSTTSSPMVQTRRIPQTTTYYTPAPVYGSANRKFHGAKDIAAAQYHTCALKNDGTVWCWSAPLNLNNNNVRGELGDGTNSVSESNYPVQVLTQSNPRAVLTDVISISAGGAHTCALKRSGTIWCWGDNITGTLGNGTTQNSNVATKVDSPLVFTAVSAGITNTCAIDTTSALWCWGEQVQFLSFGSGTSLRPRAVVDRANNQVTGVSSLAHVQNADRFTAYQKKNDNSFWGVGIIPPGRDVGGPNTINVSNFPGQFVDSNNNPVQAKFGSTGGGVSGHGCILNLSGTAASCWGWNYYGQLGDDTQTDRQFPVVVQSPRGGPLDGLFQIETSYIFTCALRRTPGSEEVWCWGWNYYGQLGTGTNVSSNLPVRAALP